MRKKRFFFLHSTLLFSLIFFIASASFSFAADLDIYGLDLVNSSGVENDATFRVFYNDGINIESGYKLFYKHEYDDGYSNVTLSQNLIYSNTAEAIIPGSDILIDGNYEAYIGYNNGVRVFPLNKSSGFRIVDKNQDFYDMYLKFALNDSEQKNSQCDMLNGKYDCGIFVDDYAAQVMEYSKLYYETSSESYKNTLNDLLSLGWGNDDDPVYCNYIYDDYSCSDLYPSAAKTRLGLERQANVINFLLSSYSYYPNNTIIDLVNNYANGIAQDCSLVNNNYTCTRSNLQNHLEHLGLSFAKAYYYTGNETYFIRSKNILRNSNNDDSFYNLNTNYWLYRSTGNISYANKILEEFDNNIEECKSTSCNIENYTKILNFYFNVLSLLSYKDFVVDQYLEYNMSNYDISKYNIFNISFLGFDNSNCDIYNDFECEYYLEQSKLSNLFYNLANSLSNTSGFYDFRVLKRNSESINLSIKYNGNLVNPKFYYLRHNDTLFNDPSLIQNKSFSDYGIINIDISDYVKQDSAFIKGYFLDENGIRFPQYGNLTVSKMLQDEDFDSKVLSFMDTNPSSNSYCKPNNPNSYDCKYDFMQGFYIKALSYNTSNNYISLDGLSTQVIDVNLEERSNCNALFDDNFGEIGDFICESMAALGALNNYVGTISTSSFIQGYLNLYKYLGDFNNKIKALMFIKAGFVDNNIWNNEFYNSNDYELFNEFESVLSAYLSTGNRKFFDQANSSYQELYSSYLSQGMNDVFAYGLLKGYSYFGNDSIYLSLKNYIGSTDNCIFDKCSVEDYSIRMKLMWDSYGEFLNRTYMENALDLYNSDTTGNCSIQSGDYSCINPYDQAMMIEALSIMKENYVFLNSTNLSIIIYSDSTSTLYDKSTVTISLFNYGDVILGKNLILSGSLDRLEIPNDLIESTSETIYSVSSDLTRIEFTNLPQDNTFNFTISTNVTNLGENTLRAQLDDVINTTSIEVYDDSYKLDTSLFKESKIISKNNSSVNLTISNNNVYIYDDHIELYDISINVDANTDFTLSGNSWDILNNVASKNQLGNSSINLSIEINSSEDKVVDLEVITDSKYGGSKTDNYQFNFITQPFIYNISDIDNIETYIVATNDLVLYEVVTLPIYVLHNVSFNITNNKPFNIDNIAGKLIIFDNSSNNDTINITNVWLDDVLVNKEEFDILNFAEDEIAIVNVEFYIDNSTLYNASTMTLVLNYDDIYSDNYSLRLIGNASNIEFSYDVSGDVYYNISKGISLNYTNDALIDQTDIYVKIISTSASMTIERVDEQNYYPSVNEYNISNISLGNNDDNLKNVLDQNDSDKYEMNLNSTQIIDVLYFNKTYSEILNDTYFKESKFTVYYEMATKSVVRANLDLNNIGRICTTLLVGGNGTFECDLTENISNNLNYIAGNFSIENESSENVNFSLNYMNLNVTKYYVKYLDNSLYDILIKNITKKDSLLLNLDLNFTGNSSHQIYSTGLSNQSGLVYNSENLQIINPMVYVEEPNDDDNDDNSGSGGGGGGGGTSRVSSLSSFELPSKINSLEINNILDDKKLVDYLKKHFGRNISFIENSKIDEIFMGSDIIFIFTPSTHVGDTYNVSVDFKRLFGGFALVPIIDSLEDNIVYTDALVFDDFVLMQENTKFYFEGLDKSELQNVEYLYSKLNVLYINDYILQKEIVNDIFDNNLQNKTNITSNNSNKNKNLPIVANFIDNVNKFNYNIFVKPVFYILLVLFIIFMFVFASKKLYKLSLMWLDKFQIWKNTKLVKDKSHSSIFNEKVVYDADLDIVLSLNVKTKYFEALIRSNKYEDAKKHYNDIISFIDKNKNTLSSNLHRDKINAVYSKLNNLREDFLKGYTKYKNSKKIIKPKKIKLLDEDYPEYDIFLKLKHLDSDISNFKLEDAKKKIPRIEDMLGDLDEIKKKKEIDFIKEHIQEVKNKIVKSEESSIYKIRKLFNKA